MTPVLFLHGFLGSSDEWNETIAALDAIEGQSIELPDADTWQAGVALLISRFPPLSHLVGYSMGGRLALGCAIAAPSRFASLTLLSAQPGLAADDRAERRTRDHLLADELERSPAADFLTKWYDQPLFKNVTAEQKAQWIGQRTGLNCQQQARRLRAYSVAEQPDYWSQLGRLKIPVTYLAGERDIKYRSVAERIAALSENVTVEIMPDVGHAMHREAPTATARWLEKRLSKETIEEEFHE